MYESRPSLSRLRDLAAPRWKGEPAEGQSILLYCEQGFGDALQFLRYAPLVRERARAGRMILDCHPELEPLLTQSFRGEMEITPRRRGDDSAFPKTDWHLPLLSAPLALGILEPLPMPEPYLHADSGQRTIWRERLGSAEEFRVGLAWKGFPRHPRDRARSMAREGLLPLVNVPGVRLYSLQVGASAVEGASMAAAGIIDLAPQIGDFADTAAIVAELDLAISVDTAVAHLAGGLGRPVWTLLSFAGEWRWGIAGESTPWYPSMRLFRQASPGEWKPVLRRVAEELASLATA